MRKKLNKIYGKKWCDGLRLKRVNDLQDQNNNCFIDQDKE